MKTQEYLKGIVENVSVKEKSTSDNFSKSIYCNNQNFLETPFPFETFPSFQFSKSGEILEEKEVMVRQDYKNTS